MAKPTATAILQAHISRFINFWNFTKAYLRRNNPLKIFLSRTLALVKEMLTVRKKLQNIERRINYERYKLKKTELILAQNSEHVFLRGRSLNQNGISDII